MPPCYLPLLFWNDSVFARQSPQIVSHPEKSWKGHQFEVLRLK